MHPEYVHDYILPGYEHQLTDVVLQAQETDQYLFFLPAYSVTNLKQFFKMLNKELDVQECDTTKG
jgi:hypothetical protein